MTNWDLVEILRWLETSGAATLVTWLASWLAEYWPWWHAQSAIFKRMASVIACVVVAVGAHAALVYVPPEVWTELQPWFKIIATAITLILGTQLFHKVMKRVVPEKRDPWD